MLAVNTTKHNFRGLFGYKVGSVAAAAAAIEATADAACS
jgi:hypothetical protein